MDEQEKVAWLWQSFPTLAVDRVMDHGAERAMVDEEKLNEHLQKLALHFFRGGVAAANLAVHTLDPTLVQEAQHD